MKDHCRPDYFLLPSSLLVSKEAQWVTTVLGSCVSVCFCDPVKSIGGITHFMLPYWNGDGLESPKYGNVAITQLLNKMLELGVQKENIICKVFGGAEILSEQKSLFNVGQRNVELAFRMIAELEIPVAGFSTGGKLGRKILFNTGTGEVLQKYLLKSDNNNTK
jgi:chemotaxis protein CheD